MKARGFTLIELAIVLTVMATLATAALAPLGVQREARQRRETVAALDLAVEALYGYALGHGRLPCPDALDDGDGREDRDGSSGCRVRDGWLPALELGVDGRDAWRRRLRYQVTARTPGRTGGNFVIVDDGWCDAADGDLDLCERGDITIAARGDDPATAANETKAAFTLADGVPAAVWSHGANGHGAPGAASPPAGYDDEAANADGDNRLVARDYGGAVTACSDGGAEHEPLCAFDDLVRWLSPTVLVNRLVVAGRLP
ncbi:MAG: type II secretion system protein [Gammaproteobacteria bacterium]